MDCFLEIQHLSKNFGATKALQDFSLKIEAGEVHALLGENGAGKSTLIKILSGVYHQDSGEICFCDDHYTAGSVVKARSLGISTAFQELSLLPNLTVAENLFLPNIKKNIFGLISGKKTEQMAKSILDEFEIDDIKPSQKVASTLMAQRQRLETVRAMIYNPKILILDEATASLINPEWFFKHVEQFVKEKGASILFITHRLMEARRLCTRFTILQNGCRVATEDFNDVSDKEIFGLMTGRVNNNATFSSRSSTVDREKAEVNLVVKNLRANKKTPKDKGISFSLRRGEILGVAGLDGQGQHDLFNMLGGIKPIMGGDVEIEGLSVSVKNPHNALKLGLILVPEERKTEGIFPGMKSIHNMTLPVLSKVKNWIGLVNKDQEVDQVDAIAEQVQLDASCWTKPLCGKQKRPAFI